MGMASFGFTYAIQVPVGKEIQAKQMLLNAINRLGNPGILAVHALETFTQTFGDKNIAPKQLKAKLPGYIFVTINRSERFTSRQGGNLEAGLGMDAACWQLLRKVPLVKRIINKYIKHEEWEEFFLTVDLEPEACLVDRENKYASTMALLRKTLEALKQKKCEAAETFRKALSKIEKITRGSRNIYSIPYSLFEYLKSAMESRNKGSSKRKQTLAQGILFELQCTLKEWMVWAKA